MADLLIDTLYSNDETWAKAITKEGDDITDEKIIHKDSNGTVLQAGDTVVHTNVGGKQAFPLL